MNINIFKKEEKKEEEEILSSSKNLIENTSKNLKKEDKTQNNEILKEFSEFDVEYKPLGCGVHNKKYYFAIAGDKKKIFLVSSNKKMYVDELRRDGKKMIQEDFGIKYKHKFIHEPIEMKWSKESITKWMNEDIDIDLKDLFFEIKNIFKYYIDHPDDRIINYYVTDVICSYFMPLFQTKGRTVLYAPAASGKSRTLTIFALLCFNAKIQDKSSSIAAMYRFISSTNGTIIRDNMDRDGDSIKEFMDIIETGYKKGTSTTKCTGRDFEIQSFETFSHVIYANISGISDPTTISRCNLIELVKTDNKEITKREINSEDEKWQNLKDKLYVYAMNEWKNIEKAYNHFEEDNFYSRDLEKLKANLVIAKLVDVKIYEGLIDCFKEIEENLKVIDYFDNKLYYACEYIHLMLEESTTKEIKFKIKEVVQFMINKDYIEKEKKQNVSQYLGRIFSNHSRIFERGYSGKNVAYVANEKSFKKFVRDHGFEKIFEKGSEDSEDSKDSIDSFEMDDDLF